MRREDAIRLDRMKLEIHFSASRIPLRHRPCPSDATLCCAVNPPWRPWAWHSPTQPVSGTLHSVLGGGDGHVLREMGDRDPQAAWFLIRLSTAQPRSHGPRQVRAQAAGEQGKERGRWTWVEFQLSTS